MARKIAQMDQARAGVGELSKLAGEFYRLLRAERVPRRLSYVMTRDFTLRLMGAGVSE